MRFVIFIFSLLLSIHCFSQSKHVLLVECDVIGADISSLSIFYPADLLEKKMITSEYGLLMVKKVNEEIHLHSGRLEIREKEREKNELNKELGPEKDYELSMSLPQFSKRGGVIIDLNMDERFKALTKKQIPGSLELIPFEKDQETQKVKLACTKLPF